MKNFVILSIVLAMAGCQANPNAAAPAGTKPTAQTAQLTGTPAQTSLLTGRVAETINAAGYTYIRLDAGGREAWVAVREAPLNVGETVTIEPQLTMGEFESSTLERKFSPLIFGAIAGGESAPVQHMTSGAADVGDVKIEKAKGGKTVAEAWAERKSLAGQQVVIRGKVVKFRPEIMGTNFVHIRDGSGSAEGGDHDITVTTDDTVKVGDVVVVSGTLTIEKDFGAGYVYPVIVEKAKVVK